MCACAVSESVVGFMDVGWLRRDMGKARQWGMWTPGGGALQEEDEQAQKCWGQSILGLNTCLEVLAVF